MPQDCSVSQSLCKSFPTLRSTLRSSTYISPRELKAVRKLPFCYVCGERLAHGEGNRDHVPSSSCISDSDRPHSPLILPSHPACNSSFALADESNGQFRSMLHGRLTDPAIRVLKERRFYREGGDPNSPDKSAFTNVDMYGTVDRGSTHRAMRNSVWSYDFVFDACANG